MSQTQNGGGIPRQGTAARVSGTTTNHRSSSARTEEAPTPPVVGVVTVDVGKLERLGAIPPGVEVCVDLGNRRTAELPDLDRIAGSTWDMRAVQVQGRHPEAVRYAADYLKRAHRQHATLQNRLAHETANRRDAWWGGES